VDVVAKNKSASQRRAFGLALFIGEACTEVAQEKTRSPWNLNQPARGLVKLCEISANAKL